MFEFRELAQQAFLFGRQFAGHFDQRLHAEVATPPAARIDDTLAADREDFTAVRPRWNAEHMRTVECGDFDFGSQSCLAVGHRQLQQQVIAVAVEQAVRLDGHKQMAIARRSAIRTRFTLASETDAHAVVDAGGNINRSLDPLCFQAATSAIDAGMADRLAGPLATGASGLDPEDAGRLDHLPTSAARGTRFRLTAWCSSTAITLFAVGATAERDLFGHTAGRFLQRQRHIAADVGATPHTTAAASPTEQVAERASAEEVSEGVKNVFDVVELRTSASDSRMSELVVAASLFRITQNLVRLTRFLEMLNRIFVVAVTIWMVANRELAIGLIDDRFGRGPFDTQDFIVAAFFRHNSHFYSCLFG